MTIHYHGSPITPNDVLLGPMAGRHFCVSHAWPRQLELLMSVAQSILGDCGAFTIYQMLKKELLRRQAVGEVVDFDDLRLPVDWTAYYSWSERILVKAENWVIIPDVIDAGSQEQDALIRQWPHGQRGAPVWHMDEPLDRLLQLVDTWPKVCIGSTGQFWQILSEDWEARMDEVWEALQGRHRFLPWIHMLRGMQLVAYRWPFSSVDSTDVAQNHNRLSVDDATLIDCEHDKPAAVIRKTLRWDRQQTPAFFLPGVRKVQEPLL